MSVFNSENRDAWQAIADAAAANRPSVGKSVQVTKGRKHKGKSGIVRWHGVNKYYGTRYKSDAQIALMEINGREGYSVKIETESGETFFVPAEYVDVLPPEQKDPDDAEIERAWDDKVAAQEQTFEESYDQQQDEREAQEFFDEHGIEYGGTCPDCGHVDAGCTCDPFQPSEADYEALRPQIQEHVAAEVERLNAEDPYSLSDENPKYSAVSKRVFVTVEGVEFMVWRLHWSGSFVEYDVYEPTTSMIGGNHSTMTHTDDGRLWGSLISFYPYERFEHLAAGSPERIANNQSWHSMRHAIADEIAMLAFPHDFQEGYSCMKGKRIAASVD